MGTKKIGSIKKELLKKSREAALTGVQIFNNPNISFKSESYVVLMIIAWTYLLHAYFRDKGIEYRYYKKIKKYRRFVRTKYGAFKYWELERCLNDKKSPIDKNTKNNLKFLIGLRNEIEHKMSTRIDEHLASYFQASCLNYNQYIKKLFGNKYGIDRYLSFSLQFSTITHDQKEQLESFSNLPKNIKSYINEFNNNLTEHELTNLSFSYGIFFVPKIVNHKNQANQVIEFIKSDSPLAKTLNKQYRVIKEREKGKYLPGQIVEEMHKEGFEKFRMYDHTKLWKSLNAKDEHKGYGVLIANKYWYWYEKWVDVVKKHCRENKGKYT